MAARRRRQPPRLSLAEAARRRRVLQAAFDRINANRNTPVVLRPRDPVVRIAPPVVSRLRAVGTGFGRPNSVTLRSQMVRQGTGLKRKRRMTNRSVIPRMMGRGDYWSDFKSGAKKLYGGVKEHIPAGTFSKIGESAFGGTGGAAGNLFSKLVGFGDYNVVANSLHETSQKMNMGVAVPAFGNISNGTVVQHREYIQDILGFGDTAFHLQSFPLNPGMLVTFPWLNALASNYEQYEFRGMVFEFKSLSSDSTGGSASALGSITMATDYDSVDADFATKQAMEQSQYCTSGKPSCDILHPIECAPNRTSIPINYIRTKAPPPSTDIRLFDLGKFQIAVSGIPAASAPAGALLGELWVTYEIVLYKPVQNPQLANIDFVSHWSLTGPGSFSTGSALGPPGVANLPPRAGSNLGVVTGPNPNIIGATSNDCFIFPVGFGPGVYEIYCFWVGAVVNRTVALTAVLNGPQFVAVNNIGGDTVSVMGSAVDANADVVSCLTTTFRTFAPLTSVHFINIVGTQTATPSFAEFFVVKLPTALIT